MLTSDALVVPLFGGLVAGVVALILGFLLARYRASFFAMLTLAFSMILYGLLSKMSVLKSTYSRACPIAPIIASKMA